VVFLSVNVVTHVKEQNQTQRRHLRLCSQAEPEHRQIYQRLNLKEVALPRKVAAAKRVVTIATANTLKYRYRLKKLAKLG
jgi:hypothetical protein